MKHNMRADLVVRDVLYCAHRQPTDNKNHHDYGHDHGNGHDSDELMIFIVVLMPWRISTSVQCKVL